MAKLRKLIALMGVLMLLCGCAATAPAAESTAPVFTEVTEQTDDGQGPYSFLMPAVISDPAPTVPTAYGEATVVRTVDEFLAAIQPDARILLPEGTFDLSKAMNYNGEGTLYYHWESVFDGVELVIDGADGLEIIGADREGSVLSAEPRYANVITFRNCECVTVANLTLGHTEMPGTCRGGVLNFDRCDDAAVEGCNLYGCGIRGVDAVDSRNIRVQDTAIYQCSYGASYIERCYNVLFENCKFHDCYNGYGLFEIANSREVAVINSEIFRNSGACLVSSNCQGVYFGGLDVHDNTFEIVFNLRTNPITVQDCRFENDYRLWYDELGPVRFDGKTLTDGDLNRMDMRTVSWTPAPLPVADNSEAGADGKVHVTNVDEFLAAIANDTVIFLEPGEYDLSTADSYGSLGGTNYYWMDCMDGPGLVISGVSGLTIEGSGVGATRILAAPRYADVLRFENCDNLMLSGFTAGHTGDSGSGSCSGGVLDFEGCSGVRVDFCSLFGCGILGISTSRTRHMTVYNTEIYDCSYGAAWLFNSHFVEFIACDIHDNGPQTFMVTDGSTNVTVDGEEVE